mgnify:FL=1
MIVDLILLSTIGAAFYGGFRLGNKFKTVKDARSAADEFVTK